VCSEVYRLLFAVFFCEGIFGTLQREMMESAYSDGSSLFTTFLRLGLLFSVLVLVSGAIFQFMWVRNDQQPDALGWKWVATSYDY